MPAVIADTVTRFVNPTSPADTVEVRTVAILTSEDLEMAEVLSAVGLDPSAEWDIHKALSSVGDTALVVLTMTAG